VKPFYINGWNKDEYPLKDDTKISVLVSNESQRLLHSFAVIEAAPALEREELLREVIRKLIDIAWRLDDHVIHARNHGCEMDDCKCGLTNTKQEFAKLREEFAAEIKLKEIV
jgi:hypothetical protein